MDFDLERNLEDAGIDAFDFSLMNDDERREVLNDAGLDPNDYEDIEFEESFSAWSALQDSGTNLWELDLMDDDEKRESYENAGLSSEDYCEIYTSLPTKNNALSEEKTETPPIERNKTKPGLLDVVMPAENDKVKPKPQYHICGVKFDNSAQIYSYRADGFHLAPGDMVEVPAGNRNIAKVATVILVGDYTEENAPYPVGKMKPILRRVIPGQAPQEENTIAEERVSAVATMSGESAAHRLRSRTAILSIALVIIIGVLHYSNQEKTSKPLPVTASPTIGSNVAPSLKTTPKPVQTTRVAPTPQVPAGGPPIGKKLSRDDSLYFLGGGGKIGGVSTDKFRYYNGSEFFVVYLDKDYVIKKVEEYLPAKYSKGTNSIKKDNEKKKSSDPYNASDYVHPDDFYYDYYDDFWDFEDAEDYWEKHH